MHLGQASFTGDRQSMGDKEKNRSGNQIHLSKQRELSRSLIEMFLASPICDRQSEV
jgi:hypothetical protein